MKTCTCLCVDVGNSQTVVGIFKNDTVVESWRLTTKQPTTSDEVFLRLRGLVEASKIGFDEVCCCGLASVVPSLERPWLKAVRKLFGIDCLVVSNENCLNLPIHYDNPSQLGADRIANVLALQGEGLKDGIVLDLGTATTIDILLDSEFYGGVIMPGIGTTSEMLTEKAAQLPPVSLSWPSKVVATNTLDALRSGLLHGFTAQLDVVLSKVKNELNRPNIPVLATGGWSELLLGQINGVTRYDPFLTLKGIRRVGSK